MHGLTVGQMAAGVGKSDRWIRLIESGQERPTEEVYVAYLETLYGRRKVPESKARKMLQKTFRTGKRSVSQEIRSPFNSNYYK